MERRERLGEEALLEWINSFPLSEKATSLKGLSNGYQIWQVLHDVDPVYFTDDFLEGSETSAKYAARWKNINFNPIYFKLRSYVEDELHEMLPKRSSIADLELMTEDTELGEVVKLLKLVLWALIKCPRYTEYISKMLTFRASTQVYLKDLIQELQATSKLPADSDTPEGDLGLSPAPDKNAYLLLKERLSLVSASNEKLQEEKGDIQYDLDRLHARLDHLQESNNALRAELTKAQDESKLKISKPNVEMSTSIDKLEMQIRTQDETITYQESKMSELQTQNDALQIQVDKLHTSNDKVRQLRDELDEVKAERNELSKKTNTIEKYKQKLQASSKLEQEYGSMKQEIEDVRGQLKIADKARQQVAGLQLAIKEYNRTLPKIEQDCRELEMMKKQLEHDNAALVERCEVATEQHAQDRETIADLRDKLGSTTSSRNSGSSNGDKLTLDKMLGQTSSHSTDSQIDEIQQLRGSVEHFETATFKLQQILDQTNAKLDESNKRYTDTYQEKLTLESSLAAIRLGQLRSSPQECTSYRELYNSFKEEHTKQKAVPAINLPNPGPLKEVKTTDSNELTKLQNEYNSLLQCNKDLELKLAEYPENAPKGDQSKTDSEATKAEIFRTQAEISETLELIKSAEASLNKHRVDGTHFRALETNVRSLASKVMDSNGRLAKAEEHIQTQNATIKVLSDRLRPAPDDPKLERENANLKRELRLMASAFHGLGSRMQMNGVVVQRRAEAPRSWLGRQRDLVEGSGLGVR